MYKKDKYKNLIHILYTVYVLTVYSINAVYTKCKCINRRGKCNLYLKIDLIFLKAGRKRGLNRKTKKLFLFGRREREKESERGKLIINSLFLYYYLILYFFMRWTLYYN